MQLESRINLGDQLDFSIMHIFDSFPKVMLYLRNLVFQFVDFFLHAHDDIGFFVFFDALGQAEAFVITVRAFLFFLNC